MGHETSAAPAELRVPLRQKRAKWPQVQVEVFDGEAEVVPQLGHA
jgi:hypothetical protein